MSELIQYHVVNVDLIREYKVSGGKMAAQIAHGSTIVAVEIQKSISLTKRALFKEWYADGKHQKKIVLRGKEKELKKLIDLGAYPVYDNGHNFVPPGSLTAVVFSPMTKENAPKMLKRLQIYNGDEHL
jgi:peptidyl-tRNA hydrolase